MTDSPVSVARGARSGGAHLARFAWAVLGYNLLVILWGALVRATGSGAGCGSHWPLCDGEVVPRALAGARAIEYAHRVSSGLALVAVVALVVAVFRARPAATPRDAPAVWALVFVLLEAGIGAGLVLFELVAENASMARAMAISAHLVNTLFLLAALALAARAAPLADAGARTRIDPGGFAACSRCSSSPARAAPWRRSATRSFRRAHSPRRSPRISRRARTCCSGCALAHPALAAAAAAAVLLFASGGRPGAPRRRAAAAAFAAAALALAQIGVGLVNVALLAPISLQLAHLLLADLLWIATLLAAVAD